MRCNAMGCNMMKMNGFMKKVILQVDKNEVFNTQVERKCTFYLRIVYRHEDFVVKGWIKGKEKPKRAHVEGKEKLKGMKWVFI